jgi:hypothetical protein
MLPLDACGQVVGRFLPCLEAYMSSRVELTPQPSQVWCGVSSSALTALHMTDRRSTESSIAGSL